MNTISFYKPVTGDEVGTWTLDHGEITASPKVQTILDSAMRGRPVHEVWKTYSAWSNGYLASHLVVPEVKAFDGDGDGMIYDGTPMERPKAFPRDGDGDGMIYEGTPRERPAVVRAVNPSPHATYVGQPLYHGTFARLAVGDILTPAGEVDGRTHDASNEQVVYATPNLGVAGGFAEMALSSERAYEVDDSPSPHVYRVEPLNPDDLEPDWEGNDERDFQSPSGYRVLEVVGEDVWRPIEENPYRLGPAPAPTPTVRRPTPEGIAALTSGGVDTFGDGTPLPPVPPGKVRLWHFSATGNREGITGSGLSPRAADGTSLAEDDGHPAGVYLASYREVMEYAESGGDLYAVDVDPAALEFDPFHREDDGTFLPSSPVYIPDGQVATGDVHLVQPDELGVLWDRLDQGQAWTADDLNEIAAAAVALRSAGHITAEEHDWIAKRIESLPRATPNPPEGYRGNHQPNDEGPTVDDLRAGDLLPSDVYEHPEFYTGYIEPEYLAETVATLSAARGNPAAMVTIYRAAPAEAGGINPGDWVTLSRSYARDHSMHATDPTQDMPIHEMRVPASSVRFAGDDLMEYGYFPPVIDSFPGLGVVHGIGKKDIKLLVRDLEANGWTIRDGKHYVAKPPDKSMEIVTFSKTPSDNRAWLNILAQLRKSGYDDGKFRNR